MVRVSAAPWIPVREVRIVVNGGVARRIELAESRPRPLERLRASLPLDELLPAGTRDAWLLVEAGEPLPLAADLDGDGIPDTGDNDGDGVVDRRDVAPGDDVGPLGIPPAPADAADPGFEFAAVSAGGLPQAFTNPFLLDRDGDGRFEGPGLPGARP